MDIDEALQFGLVLAAGIALCIAVLIVVKTLLISESNPTGALFASRRGRVDDEG
jgi:hypothetical protein